GGTRSGVGVAWPRIGSKGTHLREDRFQLGLPFWRQFRARTLCTAKAEVVGQQLAFACQCVRQYPHSIADAVVVIAGDLASRNLATLCGVRCRRVVAPHAVPGTELCGGDEIVAIGVGHGASRRSTAWASPSSNSGSVEA